MASDDPDAKPYRVPENGEMPAPFDTLKLKLAELHTDRFHPSITGKPLGTAPDSIVGKWVAELSSTQMRRWELSFGSDMPPFMSAFGVPLYATGMNVSIAFSRRDHVQGNNRALTALDKLTPGTAVDTVGIETIDVQVLGVANNDELITIAEYTNSPFKKTTPPVTAMPDWLMWIMLKTVLDDLLAGETLEAELAMLMREEKDK